MVAVATIGPPELVETVMEVTDGVGTPLPVARSKDRRAEECNPGKDDDQDEYDGQAPTTPTLSLPAGKVASGSPDAGDARVTKGAPLFEPAHLSADPRQRSRSASNRGWRR